MSKLLIIFLFITVLILILFITRIVTYNKYINRINNNYTHLKEDFEGSLSKEKVLSSSDNNIHEILKNPNIIYTDISGNIFVVDSSSVYIINGNKVNITPLKTFLDIDTKLTIDGGYYDHMLNTLNMFRQGEVITYSFIAKQIVSKLSKREFFSLEDTQCIVKNALPYFDKLILFTNNGLKVYCKNTNKLISDGSLKNVFDKIPPKISACFINFQDVEIGIPIGTPTFIKNGDIYRLNLKNNTVSEPTRVENGFFSNTETLIVKKTDKKFYLEKSGNYRVFVFGAGLENAGLGGLIFNDIYIKNKDMLSLICGTSGDRLPVKGQETLNKLSEVYSTKLPYNASCSGSGGTFLFIDKKLKLVAGGGAGWSSELIKPPSFCNSEKFKSDSNGLNTLLPKIIIPIKKIIIMTDSSDKNIRNKINVTAWETKIYNIDNLSLDVLEIPSSSLDKKNIYETSYTEFGETAQIEFTFKDVISDYKINLDYEVISTSNNNSHTNSKVIIIDEQYRKYVIDNFNYFFKNKYLTSESIYKFVNRNLPSKKSLCNLKQKEFVTHGLNSDTNRDIKFKEIVEHSETFIPSENNRFILIEGGEGGGGHSVSDKQSSDIIASGGGGYCGGKTCYNGEKVNVDYAGGCGGTSFIDKINFKPEFVDKCEKIFVNASNNRNGYVIFQLINKNN